MQKNSWAEDYRNALNGSQDRRRFPSQFYACVRERERVREKERDRERERERERKETRIES